MIEATRGVARHLLNVVARRRVSRTSKLDVAESSRINYRRIRTGPGTLMVADRAVLDSDIYSYLPSSLLSVGARSFVGGAELHCAGRIIVEDDVLIAWGCMIMDHNAHSTSRRERRNDVTDLVAGREKDWSVVRVGAIRICCGAWVCARAIILKDVTIGEGAIVAAGSVVTKDVLPYTVVAGNPAEPVPGLSAELS